MDGTETPPPEEGGKARRRAVYLLPNLFTTGVILAGFYSVVQSVNGSYEKACLALFVAMVLDVFDGMVARMTNTQSAFGGEYDSLADVIAFGMAPALLAYLWGVSDLGRVGAAFAFVYVAATAIRLARFNILPPRADRDFVGLPCPAAAALVTAFVWMLVDLEVDTSPLAWPIAGAALLAVAALSMVGNTRYMSLKRFGVKGRIPLRFQLAMIAVIALLGMFADDLPILLFFLFATYWFSGYAPWLLSLTRRVRERPGDG